MCPPLENRKAEEQFDRLTAPLLQQLIGLVALPVVGAAEEGSKDKNRDEVSTFYPVVSVNTLPR